MDKQEKIFGINLDEIQAKLGVAKISELKWTKDSHIIYGALDSRGK